MIVGTLATFPARRAHLTRAVAVLAPQLARLCHERGITQVCLPRANGWIRDGAPETSIYQDFTKREPRHVTSEIRQFAFRVADRDTRV